MFSKVKRKDAKLPVSQDQDKEDNFDICDLHHPAAVVKIRAR